VSRIASADCFSLPGFNICFHKFQLGLLRDGTSLVAGGRNGAVSVIAIAESSALYDPGAAFYMNKLAVGRVCTFHHIILKSIHQLMTASMFHACNQSDPREWQP
jgi:hypothetical protein